jgi:phage terminase small subunit
MKTTKRLTAKQKRFVDEYLIDLNASQAAVRAGYRHPDIGRQQLTKSHVRDAVEKAKALRVRRTQITQDRVLQEEAKVAFSDPRELFNPDGTLIPLEQLPERIARALASFKIRNHVDKQGNQTVTYEYKLWDKGRALERVEKHLGMFAKDNAQVGKATGDAVTEAFKEILTMVDGATRGLPNKTQGKL